MIIKGILFDLIGTTVLEKDSALISNCLLNAFKDHSVPVPVQSIQANRGRDKRELINLILTELRYSTQLCEPILNSFNLYLEKDLNNFSEAEGFRETITRLHNQKIRIGIGTGLSRDLFNRIYQHLHWESIPFSYIGIAEEIGKGRPHPDMIFDMLKACNLKASQLLKVGDTVADIQEGKNANVLTVAMLSGTQHERDLIRQKPDFTIRSLSELNAILQGLP